MKATGPVAETVFPVTSVCVYTNGVAKVIALRPR
jgi:C4-dicarboxylate transporter